MNVREDYRKYFGGVGGPEPGGHRGAHRLRRHQEHRAGRLRELPESASHEAAPGWLIPAIRSRLSTRGGHRRPAGGAPHPRAGGRRGGREWTPGRRAGRTGAAQFRPRHRREDRDQRGDGGLPARVPAGGGGRGGGDVRRGLRPPRGLGHHQFPLAALHRQRARSARASTSTAGPGCSGRAGGPTPPSGGRSG